MHADYINYRSHQCINFTSAGTGNSHVTAVKQEKHQYYYQYFITRQQNSAQTNQTLQPTPSAGLWAKLYNRDMFGLVPWIIHQAPAYLHSFALRSLYVTRNR
ncbi:hypothetical protein BaRGS_00026864 [Batillaria attramentaria]|uniref:Uncharacterized protein n=1 Tax=Batillaria attramentaria TaxID=370345 RepID=A0ABD0K4E0_9CAEN